MAGGDVVQFNSGGSGAVTGSTATVTLPAGATAGNDIIIAFCPTGGSDPTSTPSGFTKLGASVTLGTYGLGAVYRKSATGGESSFVFNFGSGNGWAWAVAELQTGGLDGTVPAATTSTTASITSPSKVTANANDTLVAIGFGYAFFGTPPTFSGWTNTFTEIVESAATTNGQVDLTAVIATRKVTATGTYSTAATLDHSGDSAGMYLFGLTYTTGGGGTNGTVTGVAATATSLASPPAVSGVRNATVAAVAALATALTPAPTVSSDTVVSGGGPSGATATALAPTVAVVGSGSVTSVPATATAAGAAPALSATRNGTVTSVAASASASSVIPSVTGTRTGIVTAVAPTATAGTGTPTVTGQISVTVVAVRGLATAAAGIPTISAAGQGTVVTPAATATAGAPAPVVIGQRHASVTAVRATSTAAAAPPAVTATKNGTVAGIKASASASAAAPVVTSSGNVTVTAITASASAAARVPSVNVVGGAQRPTPATATASARPPLVSVFTPAIVRDKQSLKLDLATTSMTMGFSDTTLVISQPVSGMNVEF